MSCPRYLAFALALAWGATAAAQGDVRQTNPGTAGHSLPPNPGAIVTPRSFSPNPATGPETLPTIPVGSTARSHRLASRAATPTPPVAPWLVAAAAIAGTGVALYYNGDGGNSTSTSTSTSTATATATAP